MRLAEIGCNPFQHFLSVVDQALPLRTPHELNPAQQAPLQRAAKTFRARDPVGQTGRLDFVERLRP